MSNDCGECGSILRVLDIIDIRWDRVGDDFFHVFKYKCSICDNKIIHGFPLYEEGHLSDKCINLVACNSSSFPDEVVEEIGNHFSYCSVCQDKFEEKFLGKIEENIDINKRCYGNLIKSGTEVKRVIGIASPDDFGINISKFEYEDKSYGLDPKDMFHGDDDLSAFFIRKNTLIVGMVSFILIDMHLLLDRIFFRDEKFIQEEKDLYKKIRDCIIPLMEVNRVNF